MQPVQPVDLVLSVVRVSQEPRGREVRRGQLVQLDRQVQLGRMVLRDTPVLLEPPVLLDQLDPQVQAVLPDSQEPQVRLENLEFLVQQDFLGHLEPLEVLVCLEERVFLEQLVQLVLEGG